MEVGGKLAVIQSCAKSKREFEAYSWPGPVHEGWREACSGARPQNTFPWSVSLGNYGGELAMVLEEVSATWLSRQTGGLAFRDSESCLSFGHTLTELCPSSGA